jgi:hypothetical protein
LNQGADFIYVNRPSPENFKSGLGWDFHKKDAWRDLHVLDPGRKSVFGRG